MVEWFHFSDFHIGKPRAPQTTALASLIKAVELACQNGSGKVDAVFITGDIAYSGRPEEYEKFLADFLLPLRNINAFAGATVFSVPGNHDVNCDAALPIAWESIGPRNQLVFFSEDDDGAKVRTSRTVVFNAYRDFVLQNHIISPNPSEQVTLLYTDNNFPFDILATNTAFFSDREQSSSSDTTPAPIESLRQQLGGRTIQKSLVILAHHPVSCFMKKDQNCPFTGYSLS